MPKKKKTTRMNCQSDKPNTTYTYEEKVELGLD